jgi:polar amino acid transport system substrate-binding protein
MKAHIFPKSALKGLSHTMKIAAAIVPLCVATHANVAAAAGTVAPESLQIGADLTYPPYDYLDNGTPAGFDPAFMGKLATHLKLKPSFVDTRFANLILGVNANRFDVIASALYVTPERAKQIDFLPYLKTGGSLLALSGAGFAPRTPEDLCGKRVSSIKGASWIPKLASSRPRRKRRKPCCRTPSMRSSKIPPSRRSRRTGWVGAWRLRRRHRSTRW